MHSKCVRSPTVREGSIISQALPCARASDTVRQNLTSGELRNLVAKVVVTFSQAFAHLIASESADGDFLSGLGNFVSDQFTHCLGRILDEWLVKQDEFFIELIQTAIDYSVNDLVRLVRVPGIVLRLGPRDLALFIQRLGGYLLA